MFFMKKLFTGSYEYLVAGLGNPGPRYVQTRHNVGFMALEYIRQKTNAGAEKLRFKSYVSEALIDGRRVLLLRPQTYMNNSGQAVRDALAYYKIPKERLIAIYDDISLLPGRIRIRSKGSDGGHNGMKSIIYHCKTEDFARIRIGIGDRPHPDYDLADWVLSFFSEKERLAIFDTMPRVYDALYLLVKGQTAEAMNLYNRQ